MTKTKAKPVGGIIELQWLDPASLTPNPENWREHPQAQRDAFKALKAQCGWAEAVVWNRITGHLLDGHMRVEEAISAGESTVPVLVGEWSEDQERLLLTSLDPIGAMARTNRQALEALTQKTQFAPGMQSLRARLEAHSDSIRAGGNRTMLPDLPKGVRNRLVEESRRESEPESEPDDPSSPEKPRGLVEEDAEFLEVHFESSNDLGVPDLNPDLLVQPSQVPDCTFDRTLDTLLPSAWYCDSARPFRVKDERGNILAVKPEGGTLGFYTQDWRFLRVYEHPAAYLAKLRNESWTAVMEPDFTIGEGWPVAKMLWSLYRSRWCARLWQQELEVPILPHADLVDPSQGAEGFVFSTLPREVPVVAVNTRSNSGNARTADAYWKAVAATLTLFRRHKRTQVVVLYGSESQRFVKLPRGMDMVAIPTYIAARRKAAIPQKQGGASKPSKPRRSPTSGAVTSAKTGRRTR